jgi:hypothetical protein
MTAARDRLLEQARGLKLNTPEGALFCVGWLAAVAGLVLTFAALFDQEPPLDVWSSTTVLILGIIVGLVGGLWADRRFHAAATAAGLTRDEAKALQDEADRLDDD